MTAPAASHIPTPADLARPKPTPSPTPAKPTTAPASPAPADRPVTAADAISPGRLRKSERLRSMFEQGIRISRMHSGARLTALSLLGYANFQTGLIHARWRPTPEELAYATGLTTGQVLVQLDVLTSRGWLTTRTLTRGPRTGSTALQLCIPAAVLQQIRDRATRDQVDADTTPTD